MSPTVPPMPSPQQSRSARQRTLTGRAFTCRISHSMRWHFKEQINVCGYKIWPWEVGDVLCQSPAVFEAAAVEEPDSNSGKTIVAFASLKSSQTAAEEDLIAFVRARIAAYKYPRIVRILPHLPNTPGGKIRRRELGDANSPALVALKDQP